MDVLRIPQTQLLAATARQFPRVDVAASSSRRRGGGSLSDGSGSLGSRAGESRPRPPFLAEQCVQLSTVRATRHSSWQRPSSRHSLPATGGERLWFRVRSLAPFFLVRGSDVVPSPLHHSSPHNRREIPLTSPLVPPRRDPTRHRRACLERPDALVTDMRRQRSRVDNGARHVRTKVAGSWCNAGTAADTGTGTGNASSPWSARQRDLHRHKTKIPLHPQVPGTSYKT